MTPHDHREFVPGCYRCELSRDELENAEMFSSADRENIARGLGIWQDDGDHSTYAAMLRDASLEFMDAVLDHAERVITERQVIA